VLGNSDSVTLLDLNSNHNIQGVATQPFPWLKNERRLKRDQETNKQQANSNIEKQISKRQDRKRAQSQNIGVSKWKNKISNNNYNAQPHDENDNNNEIYKLNVFIPLEYDQSHDGVTSIRGPISGRYSVVRKKKSAF
jgi:hypothetical protein